MSRKVDVEGAANIPDLCKSKMLPIKRRVCTIEVKWSVACSTDWCSSLEVDVHSKVYIDSSAAFNLSIPQNNLAADLMWPHYSGVTGCLKGRREVEAVM